MLSKVSRWKISVRKKTLNVVVIVVVVVVVVVRRGADKSLARPTALCRRCWKEGSVHVPNCKSFLVTEAERKHVRRRARFQQHGDVSCHQVFFFCKARRRRKFTPF